MDPIHNVPNITLRGLGVPDITVNGTGIPLIGNYTIGCLLYTSPSPRDKRQSRMPSSA